MAEAGVADQGPSRAAGSIFRQSGSRRSCAWPKPAHAAADDLELRGQTLVEPEREVVVASCQPALCHQQVDHLVCGGAQLLSAAVQVRQQTNPGEVAEVAGMESSGLARWLRRGGAADVIGYHRAQVG